MTVTKTYLAFLTDDPSWLKGQIPLKPLPKQILHPKEELKTKAFFGELLPMLKGFEMVLIQDLLFCNVKKY